MTATDTHGHATDTHGHAAEGHEHPSERQYVAVALVLGAITAAEVGLYYAKSLPHPLLIGLLCACAFVKFTLVALWFMHLRFDSIVFRRFFVTGIVVACSVYLVFLLSLHVLD
jgi:cytochrome c oxidase subunit 4